jgi:hypothetical protein
MSAPPGNRRPASDDISIREFAPPLGIGLSPTVARVQKELGGEPVTSFEMVEAILRKHPEYARSVERPTGESFDPTVAGKRTAQKWLQDVIGLLRPDRARELHGRLLIVSLARLDPSLERTLRTHDFLPALTGEIQEMPELIFKPAQETAEPGSESGAEPKRQAIPLDQVPLHYDNPTLHDQLGRRGFARALAIRFERIWREYRSTAQAGSFIFHLHGPWGSGKSSLLEMLRDELQASSDNPGSRPASGEGTRPAPDPVAGRPWVVVNFNAWQHQRLDPPWWFLLDAVYRQGRHQLWARLKQRGRAAWLMAHEAGWRVTMGRLDVIIAALILLALATFSVIYLVRVVPDALTGAAAPPEGKGVAAPLRGYDTLAQGIGAILTLVGSLVSVVALVTRSLLSGSARAAQKFVQAGSDPMDRISRHFRRLLGWIDAPVLVVIDDLDRCQPLYVVSLLEGIQTLFTDSRVLYVLSGDRRWLYACFEKAYEPFAASVQEPGRRLGSLFLEKAVQLSVSVPRLSTDMQGAYWQYLLGKDPGQARDEAARAEAEIRGEFKNAKTEAQVFDKVNPTQEPNPIRQQVRRQVAIEHLASAPLEASTLYFLEPFAPLLEPNPRAMKRLLNDYSMQRDQAILAGHDLSDPTRRKQLALWTILCLRWPALEEHFVESATNEPRKLPPELHNLVSSSPVKRVLEGECVGTPLDRGAIGWLAGLRSVEGSPEVGLRAAALEDDKPSAGGP